MILGLICALSAAVCYGVGSILQAMAAVDHRDEVSLRVLTRLVVHRRYIFGLAFDLLGFVASVVALRRLPLFVVQAALAGSVGVTALGAHLVLGVRLHHREHAALAVLFAGFVFLGISGRPESASHLAAPGPLILLASAGVIALVAMAQRRTATSRSALVLAALAGASFGAVGIAARAFQTPQHWTDVAANPLAYAIVVHGALALMVFAAAVQVGSIATVAAMTFSVETILPAVIGLTILGDRARTGFAPVALVGFSCVLGASITLARHAEFAT